MICCSRLMLTIHRKPEAEESVNVVIGCSASSSASSFMCCMSSIFFIFPVANFDFLRSAGTLPMVDVTPALELVWNSAISAAFGVGSVRSSRALSLLLRLVATGAYSVMLTVCYIFFHFDKSSIRHARKDGADMHFQCTPALQCRGAMGPNTNRSSLQCLRCQS